MGGRWSSAALAALEQSASGLRAAIEEALKSALVEGLGLKPRLAFGPVRVAVTGRTVSPPLFESMEILGRERCTGPPPRRYVRLTHPFRPALGKVVAPCGQYLPQNGRDRGVVAVVRAKL